MAFIAFMDFMGAIVTQKTTTYSASWGEEFEAKQASRKQDGLQCNAIQQYKWCWMQQGKLTPANDPKQICATAKYR